MNQPTAELLQAIKGLAEKATKGQLIASLLNSLPTIIAALELKERVENPEVFARALCLEFGRMGDTEAVERNRVEADWPRYVSRASRIHQALKGPTNAG